MAGDEVVQLYVRDIKASVDREVKALKGFSRISLLPGESKAVKLRLNKIDLAFYDVKNKQWKAEAGEFLVLVGASSSDIRLSGKFILLD